MTKMKTLLRATPRMERPLRKMTAQIPESTQATLMPRILMAGRQMELSKEAPMQVPMQTQLPPYNLRYLAPKLALLSSVLLPCMNFKSQVPALQILFSLLWPSSARMQTRKGKMMIWTTKMTQCLLWWTWIELRG